jgi:hypothetical protein
MGRTHQQAKRERSSNPRQRRLPIDEYIIDERLMELCDKGLYHFLLVPLLGQHYPGGPDNWCGRTSACMAMNYYKKIQGKELISIWDGGSGGRIELRHADKTPYLRAGMKANLEAEIGSASSVHQGFIFDFRTANRMKVALTIQKTPDFQLEKLGFVLDALQDNNPVILYSGFSKSYGGHIVLITGYCILEGKDENQLWLLIADPSSVRSKALAGLFRVPNKNKNLWQDDCAYLDQLKTDDSINMIRLYNGEWIYSEASLYILRASHLFEASTQVNLSPWLWLDDKLNKGRKGGCCLYKEKPTPTHPELIKSNLLCRVSFPFQEKRTQIESPVRYFHVGDVTPCGHYPVGSQRILHGGVHLSPTGLNQKSKAIRCLAPGYIAALRLGRPRAAAGDDGKFANAHDDLILVRHEFEHKEQEKVYPFYSLYIHFRPRTRSEPENTEQAESPAVESPLGPDIEALFPNIDWLKRFYLARHGCAVSLDPEGDIGSLSWLAEAVDDPDGTASCTVFKPDMQGPKDIRALKTKTGEKGRYLGFIKPAPKDPDQASHLQQAFEKLLQGSLVTFSEAVLPVKEGDVLAYLRQGEQDFLHLEVFGAEKPPIEVLSVLSDDKLGMHFHVVGEDSQTEDNWLEDGELKKIVSLAPGSEPLQDFCQLCEKNLPQGSEPAEDKTARRIEGGKRAQFGRLLERFYADPETFAEAGQDDLGAEPEPSYPLKIKLSNPYELALGDPHRYVEINFWENGKRFRSRKVALSDQKKEIEILVPARSESIEIMGGDFHLKAKLDLIGSNSDLANKVIPYRYRNLHLSHLNEFRPEALKALLSRLGLLDRYELHEKRMWWDPAKEHPVANHLGEKVQLFSSQQGENNLVLDKDGKLENLHPITTIWLLRLLEQQEFISLKRAQPQVDRMPSKPLFWGWFNSEQGPFPIGYSVHVVAVSENYGCNDVELIAKAEPSPFFNLQGNYQNGVYHSDVELTHWGSFTLKAKDGPEQPKAQGLPVPVGIEVSKPELQPHYSMEHDQQTGVYLLRLTFSKNCPVSIQGLLAYHTALFQREPYVDKSKYAGNWKLSEDDNFILGLKRPSSAQVTRNFTFNEYKRIFDGAKNGQGRKASPILNVYLCLAVQVIRELEAIVRVTPKFLSSDGLQVHLLVTLSARAKREKITLSSLVSGIETSLKTEYSCNVNLKPEENNILVLNVDPSSTGISWETAEFATGFVAQPEEEKLFVIENGFITGVKSKKNKKSMRLCRGLSLNEFMKKGRKLKLSLRLVQGLIQLRGQLYKMIVDKNSINESGNEVTVTCAGLGEADLLEAAGTVLNIKKSEGMKLTVTPIDGGVLVARIHPAAVFAKLVESALAHQHDKRLKVKTSVVLPNGGFEHLVGDGLEPGNEDSTVLNLDMQQQTAAVECLQASCDESLASLTWHGFGSFIVSVECRFIKAVLPFFGSRLDWVRARPQISANGLKLKTIIRAGTIEASYPLGLKKSTWPKEDLVFKAMVINPKATFGGVNYDLEPVETTFKEKPAVKSLSVEAKNGWLHFRGKVDNWDRYYNLSIRCEWLTASENAEPKLETAMRMVKGKATLRPLAQAIKYNVPDMRGTGMCNSKGEFLAHLPLGLLSLDRQYTFTLERTTKMFGQTFDGTAEAHYSMQESSHE